MLTNICVLIIISTGVWIGFGLIKSKKYKYGVPIIISSLAALGGLSFLNNLSVTINNAQRDIANLKLEVVQNVALKQQMSNTINIVTKIEKEVANITEVIHQFNQAIRTEVFKNKDLGKKVQVLLSPDFPNNTFIFFELENIPEPNSVFVISDLGAAGFSTYKIVHNILILKTDIPSAKVMKDENRFFNIRYSVDYNSKKELCTIEGMEIIFSKEGGFHHSFRRREKP